MNKEEITRQTDRLIQSAESNGFGILAQTKEFLRTYAGEGNHFLKMLELVSPNASSPLMSQKVKEVLSSFRDYVKNDLLRSISLKREIEIETVSDYLQQAETLLKENKVHPAAPAVIIGASLEEFLRNWLEDSGFDMTSIKNSLDSYSTELRRQDKISKQDLKDIVSWGGTRNDAAHGHWENVDDRNKIKLMFEGVNLFMRKYSE